MIDEGRRGRMGETEDKKNDGEREKGENGGRDIKEDSKK